MDRAKLAAKRPVKGRGHAPPGEFFALGTKPEPKTSSSASTSRKPSTSVPSAPVKNVPSVPTSQVAKKPKIGSQHFTALGRHAETEWKASPTTQIHLYEEIAREVEPSEFLDGVAVAAEMEDDERVEALLCGAVKYLKGNRSRPEPSMCLSLMFLSKERPPIFNSEVIIEAFCSLLKREVSLSFKSKGNPTVSLLTCNVLCSAFMEEENWPDNFIKVYMEDAMGERIWVDRTECKVFVENIQSAFNTKMPKISALVTESTGKDGTTSPIIGKVDEDEESSMSGMDITINLDEDVSSLVSPRYTYQQVSIETYVLDILREQLGRRQSMDGGSRNLLRVMTATCGYAEVRTMAATRLEMWLQNPKLTRPAQDLLMAVCMNCDQHSSVDIEVMAQLCKVRLKTKPLISHYLLSVRELLMQHSENLRTLMTQTVYNELSNSRNPNNMALLGVMFNHMSDASAKILAETFQDLLANREEYLRALRILLREIVRTVRQDMNFAEFAVGLMQERTEPKFKEMEQSFKERLFASLTDLISMIALLGVSPAVKEAASAHARTDDKDLEVLRSFQRQVALIQRDSVSWLHTVAPKMFDLKQNEYVHCLRKLLFMEVPEHYTKIDNWPPENDRNLVLRLVTEVPVLEDTLLRILIMGLTRETPVNATDAIELVDQLVKRAAAQHAEGDDYQVLVVDRVDLIDLLLNLCTYRHPENITLPKGYKPPALAITNLYSKAWVIMLIISAFNPARFGLTAWSTYPMLKCIMEMVMTRNFKFPPPTMVTGDKTMDEIKNKEKQMSELEKQQIVEFEGHLAAATSRKQITDSNSLLLAQLTAMDPSGPARQPSKPLLEQLEMLNNSLGIGHLLCRSRSPDFLLDIIHRQGTSQSMPWLAELVESNDSSLDVLPVQCLCEFLLHDASDDAHDVVTSGDQHKGNKSSKKNQKLHKQKQLLGRLQNLLHSATSDARTIREVLGYFLKRLGSQGRSNRMLAVKGLSMVLAQSYVDQPDEPMDVEENPAVVAIPSHKWLLEQLPTLPQFAAVKQETCASLRQACQIETDSAAVSAYIVFLSQHTADLQLQELDELSLDLAQLIVERATLMNHLLPQEGISVYQKRADYVLASMIDLFYGYLLKAQEPEKEAYSWSNTQDQILLQWESGKSATINVLVVHAMIILLTYGEPEGVSSYHDMLEAWFPSEGHPPSAYLVDTSEEALLLPDWLKLRMIRSRNERLVDAALMDLEPSQLLLFVQSFGIPVASMSKLLKCLDQAVILDCYAMEQVVVDKGYMAQLVQVQHMRGAQGGTKFHLMLAPDGMPEITAPAEDAEMKVSPRKRVQSAISRTPEIPVGQSTGKGLADLLVMVINMEPQASGVSRTDKDKMFRSLLKSLSNPAMCASVIEALEHILRSENKVAFVKAMKKCLHVSCPILRVLVAKQAHFEEGLLTVMSLLSNILRDSKSMISRIVTSYLMKKEGVTKEMEVAREMDDLREEGQIEYDLLRTVTSMDHPRAEDIINRSMALVIKDREIVSRVDATCNLLQESDNRIPDMTRGLLIDWMQLLDPDLVAQVPELQQELLFGSHSPGGSTGGHQASQPYLLALLTHQSSWSSLHHCINLLLSDNKQNLGRFDPTTALDFIHACMYIPKIWQGRDKKIPKNAVPEDILRLTTSQVECVVHYVLAEAVGDKATGHVTLSDRLALLLRSCASQRHLFEAVVEFLNKKINEAGPHQVYSHQLLLELYLHVPDVIELGPRTLVSTTDRSITQSGVSQLDIVIHRIICTLGNAAPSKAVENKMYDANIALRKLAAQHPILVLRQLPIISALLQSRAQFTFAELKHRNHLLLYTHILGVLELLQPHIFCSEYHTALQGVLKSFFDLLRIHRTVRQLGSVVTKFIKFLNNFMTHNAKDAGKLLHPYLFTLNELTNLYHDLAPLRALLAAISLPRQDQESTLEDRSRSEVPSDLAPPRPSSPWNMAQLAPYLQRIAKGASTEDILTVLRDLDETSKRKVDILQHFISDLQRLLSDSDDQCRNTAHSLVMRYVRQNPGCAAELVPAFLRCIDSTNVDIVNSALKHLAEFCLLAQEYAGELLQKVFDVGVQTKVETVTHISEAIQLLNMETLV